MTAGKRVTFLPLWGTISEIPHNRSFDRGGAEVCLLHQGCPGARHGSGGSTSRPPCVSRWASSWCARASCGSLWPCGTGCRRRRHGWTVPGGSGGGERIRHTAPRLVSETWAMRRGGSQRLHARHCQVCVGQVSRSAITVCRTGRSAPDLPLVLSSTVPTVVRGTQPRGAITRSIRALRTRGVRCFKLWEGTYGHTQQAFPDGRDASCLVCLVRASRHACLDLSPCNIIGVC